jgi:exosortase A
MSVLKNLDYLLPISILVFAALFAPEWKAYFELWYTSIIYSHGFLVLALSIYLLWRQWPSLKAFSLAPSWLGFGALLTTCVILLLAKAADIKTITLMILPFVILSWGWSLWGLRFFRVCGIPVFILIYAAPIWDDFSPFFQSITVFANQLLLHAVNIPAEIQEFYITIPSGVFVVAGGCSGVRYLMVALCLGTVYGNMFYGDARRTIFLTLIAGALSMVANWIRVFGIIVAGHVTEMESSLIEDHETFGWIIFLAITLVPLFFIAKKLENTTEPNTSEHGVAENSPVPAGYRENAPIPIAISFLIILSVPTIFISQTRVFVESDGARLPGLPDAPENWRGPLRFADFWEPSYHNEDLDLSGIYVSQTLQKVQLQIKGYRTQGQGKELIYHSNRLYDPYQWDLISSVILQPALKSPGIDKVKESILQSRNGKERIIIWSWYYLDGYQTPSVLKAKLIGGVHALMGDGSGALIAVAAGCLPDKECETQRSNMKSLLNAVRFSR